jgi:predicted nucleic acid-binding protein
VTWVLDASSVVAYLLGEGAEPERDAILAGAHAPSLLDLEATHTFRGLLSGAKIDLATAERGLEELGELNVHRHPERHLLRRAWELRDVCTTYDAVYVALAEALDATLVTRDEPLARTAGRVVDVRLAQG